MATISNATAPFGMVKRLPLSGFPEGVARIRIRENDFVKIYIKTKHEITMFYPKEEGGKWVPLFAAATNKFR